MHLLLRIAGLAAMTILTANAAGPIYTVRTSAMEPTLLEGDHVVAPGGEPIGNLRRGDVIAFYFPLDPKVVLIKRLIGLPRDHIRITSGVLAVNSRTTSEPYVEHLAGLNASPFLNNFPLYSEGKPEVTPEGRKMLDRYATSGELIVPDGGYFVLGDNRDQSYDSRSWGFVEASQIIGLVHEILTSEDPKTNTPRAGRVSLPIERGSLK
jgi:signal peptidase I